MCFVFLHCRGREVSLLIQVPGCVLEIPGPIVAPGRGLFAQRQVVKPVTLTRNLTGTRKCREMAEIPHANSDILEFPGYVDDSGVLRVYNWTAPRAQMQHDTAIAFKEANANGGGMAGSTYETDSSLKGLSKLPTSLLNAWVFRESEAVFLLPQVQHAYVYLVPVGEEHEPPKIFGRIPLTLSERTKAAFEKSGSAGSSNEWPPAEALASGKSDSESELQQIIGLSKNIRSLAFKKHCLFQFAPEVFSHLRLHFVKVVHLNVQHGCYKRL